MDRLFNWFNGWRRDMDGFLVRARRKDDPDLTELGRSDLGFTEEACIAVRDHWIARRIDKRDIPPSYAD